jgi:hypothetical protein
MGIVHHRLLVGWILLEAGCRQYSLDPSVAVVAIDVEFLRHQVSLEHDRAMKEIRFVEVRSSMDERQVQWHNILDRDPALIRLHSFVDPGAAFRQLWIVEARSRRRNVCGQFCVTIKQGWIAHSLAYLHCISGREVSCIRMFNIHCLTLLC